MNKVRLSSLSVVKWSQAPVATEVDREVVLMHLDRGRCYGLGDTGSAVWRKLAQPIQVQTLVQDLRAEYLADPATIAADVLALLEQLQDEGLIEVVE